MRLRKILLLPAVVSISAIFAFGCFAQQDDSQTNDKVRELQDQYRRLLKDEYNPSTIVPKTNGEPSFGAGTGLKSSKEEGKKSRSHAASKKTRHGKKLAGHKSGHTRKSASKKVSGKKKSLAKAPARSKAGKSSKLASSKAGKSAASAKSGKIAGKKKTGADKKSAAKKSSNEKSSKIHSKKKTGNVKKNAVKKG
ncbi:conserved exported hypothetical protein [Syntrophobacter sp. SbD1]|nr:conserved exported hypothetical protein [Syntrophobacter sp. SbD1]